MKNLQAAANRNSSAATVAVEELRTMRTRIDSLNANLNDLENKNAALNVSVSLSNKTLRRLSPLCVSTFYPGKIHGCRGICKRLKFTRPKLVTIKELLYRERIANSRDYKSCYKE